MAQVTNQISLYKKIDETLLIDAGITVGQPKLRYIDGKEIVEINDIQLEEFENSLKVNEHDLNWSPSDHNLNLILEVQIEKPQLLFGNQGVTSKENTIGLAVHIHSKSSCFQSKKIIKEISYQEAPITIRYEEEFKQGTLRGRIHFNFFMYLAQMKEILTPIHANKTGLVLTKENLYDLELVVDGEGSAFPIGEFSEKNGPLWDLDKNWGDASLDSFDSNNVLLRLNVEHELFKKIKLSKNKESRALMGEILMQSMAMIIHQVINEEENDINDTDNVASDTILMAVKYWVETFEVETTNLFSINNSLRRNLEKLMMEESIDD